MASQLRSREFRDISLSFEPHPVTKDIPVLRDTACIRKSVSNIVQTIRGERFFDSLFGSNVRRSLFDFVDFATASVIEREITEAILGNKKNLKEIINIVHKEIKKKMKLFLNKNKNKKIVILDVPLLLENKLNSKKDKFLWD